MKCRENGQNRIRTCEGKARRFTVFPRWPLGYLPDKATQRRVAASLEGYASRRTMKMLFYGNVLKGATNLRSLSLKKAWQRVWNQTRRETSRGDRCSRASIP